MSDGSGSGILMEKLVLLSSLQDKDHCPSRPTKQGSQRTIHRRQRLDAVSIIFGSVVAYSTIPCRLSLRYLVSMRW
jgi:hypothetical protein